jgi:hypothetical protein
MAKFRFQDLKIWQLSIQIPLTLCSMRFAILLRLTTYGIKKGKYFSTKVEFYE